MESAKRGLAVVSGASTGFGHDLAKCCANHGFDFFTAPTPDPDSPLERALQHLGGVIEGRLLSNKGSGQALTT